MECLCLLIYVVLALYYYQERTLFLDNAFQVFLLIQDRDIVINSNRWPVVIFRVLPLLMVKIGASIKMIILSLSFSYMIFHIIVYGIIRFIIRDRSKAWLLLAFLIIPAAHTFYWCNSDHLIGISLVILLTSCLEHQKYIGSFLLLVILPWVHPLVFISVGFILAYYFLFTKLKKAIIGSHIVFAVGIMAIKSLVFQSWYEADKGKILFRQLGQYNFSEHHLDYLFQWTFWPILLSIFICFLVCIYYKKFGVLIYSIVGVTAYIFLQDIMIRNYSYVFYHEATFLILFFWSAFIIQKVAENFDWKKLISIAYVLFLIGFIRIISYGTSYSDRIDWFQELLMEHDRNVFLYEPEKSPLVKMEWGSPFESLLISSMDGPSKTILMAVDPENFTTEEPVFKNHFGSIPLNELDSQYFDLKYLPYTRDEIN